MSTLPSPCSSALAMKATPAANAPCSLGLSIAESLSPSCITCGAPASPAHAFGRVQQLSTCVTPMVRSSSTQRAAAAEPTISRGSTEVILRTGDAGEPTSPASHTASRTTSHRGVLLRWRVDAGGACCACDGGSDCKTA
eukprot:6208430-Pleurochrysis_carterae.AAC.3